MFKENIRVMKDKIIKLVGFAVLALIGVFLLSKGSAALDIIGGFFLFFGGFMTFLAFINLFLKRDLL